MSGEEIEKEVNELSKIVQNSYDYSGKQREDAVIKIKKLWDQCNHRYEWIDCNPHNEICKCMYCKADSPNTRSF